MVLRPEIRLFLPESFEWLILKSGLIDGNRIQDILGHPEDYIESSQFFSWEQFFTRLLMDETRDSYLQYSKSKLNPVYFNEKEKNSVLKVIKNISFSD